MSAKRSRQDHPQDIELLPDAWPRFEQMVKAVAKAGPQHKEQPAAKPPRKKAATNKTKPA